ncbi:DnaJ domain [Macleaya cordata]|uniref:DnaJ domain n=1 Tax=Macleaya cordata TaxID=56857 RepID=A0A200PQF3_MACCD|nr:DnaJ domain [Macleaya cordata]
MDGNKDEALKCLKIGKEALELGDRNRALKFINKARRLDPNLSVDDLLSSLERENGVPPSTPTSGRRDEASSSTRPAGSSSLKHRVPSSGSSSSATKTYTEEQISIVRQIRKQKDYYEILGVEKNCSVEDVRKAYRKLSLKVHPDKNQAPGAEEAFKAVSKAFQCLSDEESRKRYDVVGSDEVVYERPAARRGPQGFNGFYDAEVDAEEIFRNFFFGGGMPRATTQFGGFTFGTNMGPSVRTADHGSNSFNIRALIQLLPILLVLLLNFLPSSEPIYSLSRTYQYEHHFSTQRGVNYYVRTRKFEQDYPPNSQERITLEQRVEREYFSILSQNCRVELQRRQWGLSYETPHCDRLKQFDGVA